MENKAEENKSLAEAEEQALTSELREEAKPQLKPQRLDFIPTVPPEIREYYLDEDEDEEDEELELTDLAEPKTSYDVILELLDWTKYILIAIILGLIISYYIVQRSVVSGSSMYPTLHDQDQVLVGKLALHLRQPQLGEIVTVDMAYVPGSAQDEILVKRVIAGPGETIDFIDGVVFVNGIELPETYLPEDTYTAAPHDWAGPLVIPEDHYYVLGDNRMFSSDSRNFGPVSSEAINGHVLIRIAPLEQFGFIE